MTTIVRKQQMWRDGAGVIRDKQAEVTGTWTMPQGAVKKQPVPRHGTTKAAGDIPPATNETYQPDKAPQPVQARQLRPHVDLEAVERDKPHQLTEKIKAASYALSRERYPLDSYEQVKTAAAYFDTWQRAFSPEERREYCCNLTKRAHQLGIPLSDAVEQYGAEGFASDGVLMAGLDARKGLVTEEQVPLLSKLAAARRSVDPETWCAALLQFDRQAGIDAYYDQYIPDAYATTFGVKQAAEETIVVENHVLTKEQLKRLSVQAAEALCKTYGRDFVQEFQKDPMGIFESLPLDQKKLLAGMARAVES